MIGIAVKQGCHFDTSNAMCVKVMVEVLDDAGFQMKIANNGAVLDTLDRATDPSQ